MIVPREVCDAPAFFKSSALTYTEAPIRGSLSSPDITTPVIVRLAALAKASAFAKRHIDRKAGAQEGVYEIGDLSLTQYLVPQECGMRMDTEWLEITRHTALDNSRTDSSSQTLRIEKNDEKFAFSCLPYTASEIENALHHEELPPARRTVLCIYGAVRGVGGIDSWGTDVEEDYRISAETDKDYSFTIC